MRNLLLFISKNYIIFLFLILESICFALLVQNNFYQRASFVNSANSFSGNILHITSGIKEYINLKEVNEQLASENASLLAQSLKAKIKIDTSTHAVNDTILKQKYIYINAKVVNNSVDRRNNYLTLNKGRAQGIKPDMAVVAPSGVVGIVKEVSENFSSVMSLLHKDCHISSKLKRDGSFGPLSWDGLFRNKATLSDIPTHVRLVKGDTIVTSPYSTVFPEGIMVGMVNDYTIKSGDHFYTISVKLSTDFNRLTQVYVIGNVLKDEQEELEKQTQADKDKL